MYTRTQRQSLSVLGQEIIEGKVLVFLFCWKIIQPDSDGQELALHKQWLHQYVHIKKLSSRHCSFFGGPARTLRFPGISIE